MRVLARFPSDGADEFDLDLRAVLLGVPFTDVDQSGLDEVEAVEELQDFFVGPVVYYREPCLLADGSAGRVGGGQNRVAAQPTARGPIALRPAERHHGTEAPRGSGRGFPALLSPVYRS